MLSFILIQCSSAMPISKAQEGVIEPPSFIDCVWRMKVTGDFQPDVKDEECRLEILQDVEAGLGNMGIKLKKAVSVANMQGKRRISYRRSSLLKMAASIKKASELLGEEASIEVATKMKTIDDLEPEVKNMENRLR